MKYSIKLLGYLKKNGAATIDSLAEALGISRQYVHRLVNELMAEGQVKKNGTAPNVYYSAVDTIRAIEEPLPYEKERFLNEHFVIITALGEKLNGLEGMKYWCHNQNLPLSKTIDEFIETRQKYLNFYNQEYLIDGIAKLQNTKGIGDIGVDSLYYLDFYAIERFGKTKLGNLMHYAKQGQNKNLMAEIVQEIKNRILFLIKTHNIEAVLYVPPTITRKVQIMAYLEKNLQIDLPKVQVKKITNQIVIPQKALSKLFERVANAKSTFIVLKQEAYKKILILDDAIGSGASVNEIALKVKEKNVAQEIVGLAITGSYKSFEIISEL